MGSLEYLISLQLCSSFVVQTINILDVNIWKKISFAFCLSLEIFEMFFLHLLCSLSVYGCRVGNNYWLKNDHR